MPGQIGNSGGVKGRSGRKSAYQEFLDAQWHAKAWQEDTDAEELKAKIKTGKFSVRDRFLYAALSGNDRILAHFADKILPDISMLIGPTGGAVEVDLVGEAKKRSAKYVRRK